MFQQRSKCRALFGAVEDALRLQARSVGLHQLGQGAQLKETVMRQPDSAAAHNIELVSRANGILGLQGPQLSGCHRGRARAHVGRWRR